MLNESGLKSKAQSRTLQESANRRGSGRKGLSRGASSCVFPYPYLLQRICAPRVAEHSPLANQMAYNLSCISLFAVTPFSHVLGIEGEMADEFVKLDRRGGRSFLS